MICFIFRQEKEIFLPSTDSGCWTAINSAVSNGVEEDSRLENSTQSYRQQRGQRCLEHHHKPTCWQPGMVGSELPEGRCPGNVLQQWLLQRQSKHDSFTSWQDRVPHRFLCLPYSHLAACWRQFSNWHPSTSHSISDDINSLPHGSQPDPLNHTTAAG